MKGSPIKVLNGKLPNTRPMGKPRARWKDVVWRNTSRILGMKERSRKQERIEASAGGS
jgi:hypothetical protein